MSPNEGIDEPLRSVFSNINTTTYEPACYLAKILSPLNWSDYTVSSSKEFSKIIKLKTIPHNYKLASFYVKSPFTNIPLDSTVEIILNRIYDRKELITNIERKDMKKLILLCIKIYILPSIRILINK